MSQNPVETFEEPDSMSDQKCSQVTSADSSDSVTTDMPHSSIPSGSESNTTCSPHSSSDSGKPNSTSNETPSTSVLTSQNCSVLRKSFLNQVSNSASTSENVVSTTPKFQFKSSSFGSNILKPSALSCSKASGSCSSGFALKAPTLKNPFFKNVNIPESSNTSVDENKTSNENSQEVTSSEQVSESPTTAGVNLTSSPSTQEQPSPSSSTSLSSGLVSPPKFVPILSNTSSAHNVATGGFVFGQNLRSRVSTVEEDQSSSEASSSHPSNSTDSAIGTTSTSATAATGGNFNSFASTNGTTDMLFTSSLQKESGDAKMDSGGEDSATRHKSLSEAAREYEEARANKRKYEAVAVVTGEEEEANVLQINCKLFLYDKVKTWIELGRGQLRLNDINQSLSRIVIRVVGSLRVILNTKIWPEMVVQKPSENSVRLTAKENGQVKIYLVKASSKEIDQLYKALEWRVNNQKKLGAENGHLGNGTDESNESSESKKLITEDLVVTNGTRDVEETANSATQPQHSV